MLIIVAAYHLTRETIQTTQQVELQATLVKLLAPNTYDNDPTLDVIYLTDPALGSTDPRPIYRARASGNPTGVVISSVAPDGYNGDIELLVGLSFTGDVFAVRVTNHNETPGLGDDIEASRSDWIHSFADLSPSAMQAQEWQVKKDGGRFDQFTGATITPRAIVRSVHEVVQWYQQTQDTIYAQSSIHKE